MYAGASARALLAYTEYGALCPLVHDGWRLCATNLANASGFDAHEQTESAVGMNEGAGEELTASR